jgi:hypothetical protein
MASYMYLFRGGDTLSPEAMQQHMKKWMSWVEDLGKKGQFHGGDPLAAGGKVVRGKQKNVTDGPYAEVKDVVSGYLLVSAANLDAATELARGCPVLDNNGTVEIREVQKM